MLNTRLRKSILPIIAAAGMFSAATAHAAGDAFKGESYYAVCAGCHGADGMGLESANAPRLQGQFDWYLITQIKNFQSGARGVHKEDKYGATMRAMAGTLPNEQAILDVVAYINKL